jgi:hypothetical protein
MGTVVPVGLADLRAVLFTVHAASFPGNGVGACPQSSGPRMPARAQARAGGSYRWTTQPCAL